MKVTLSIHDNDQAFSLDVELIGDGHDIRRVQEAARVIFLELRGILVVQSPQESGGVQGSRTAGPA